MHQTKISSLVLIIIINNVIFLSAAYSVEFDNNFMSTNNNIEIFGFSSFSSIHNDSEISSTKTTYYLNFSYHNSGSSLRAQDIYRLELESDDFSDFYVEVNIDYSYSGGFLGDFFFKLRSDYTEDGSDAIDYGDSHLTEQILTGFESHPTAIIIGYPNGGDSYHQTPYGALGNQGTLVYRVSRKTDHVLCEIENLSNLTTLSYLWTNGLSRPLNFLEIHAIIDPANSSDIEVSFSGFYANLTYAENPSHTPTTPSQSSPTNTDINIPIWGWVTIGVGFTAIIVIFVVIDVLMRKKQT